MKRILKTLGSLALITFVALIGIRIMRGQGRNPASVDYGGLFANAAMPSDLQEYILALGDRVHFPGQERTSFAGELKDANGKRTPVVVTQQLPDWVVLQGFRSGGPILFDGEAKAVNALAIDEDFLETFAADSAEGMMASVHDGVAMRLLGQRFGPDPRIAPDFSGKRYDVYEVTGPVRVRLDRLIRTKRFYFDSESALLVSTRYRDTTSGADVETRFSDWRKISGSAYAGKVERFESGKLIFTFSAGAITPGARDFKAFRAQ